MLWLWSRSQSAWVSWRKGTKTTTFCFLEGLEEKYDDFRNRTSSLALTPQPSRYC